MTTTSKAYTKEMLRRGRDILERLETYVDAPTTLSLDFSRRAVQDAEDHALWTWFLARGRTAAAEASTTLGLVLGELTRLELLMDELDEMHRMAAEQRARAWAKRDVAKGGSR